MAGSRRALLVATDAYSDRGLTRLRAPSGDVRALAGVLGDPAIGGFDVQELVNRPNGEVAQEIEGFFDEARLSDLLLLYISGHGVLSPTRRLYFATSNTKLQRLRATAIDEGFLQDVMHHSRARSIVLVLDCCHSGAFGQGMVPKSAPLLDVEQRFEGQGRVTLTASKAMEYAFEALEAEAAVTDLGASSPASLFTRCLVEGLQTGDADIDHDGRVSIDELYDYVYARVRERSPHQTPGKSGAGHGDIVIAQNPHPSVPADVREAIDQALGHPWPDVREVGVAQLARLRPRADPALAAAIDQALHRAVDDDSRRVSAAAQAALRSAIEGPEHGESASRSSARAEIPEATSEEPATAGRQSLDWAELTSHRPPPVDLTVNASRFHIFLAYNSQDVKARSCMLAIARSLEAGGLRAWNGVADTRIGEASLEAARRGIEQSQCFAMLLGPEGLGQWQGETELLSATEHRDADPNFRIFVVLLPGYRVDNAFINALERVDLTEGFDTDGELTPDGFREMQRAITDTSRRQAREGEDQAGAAASRSLLQGEEPGRAAFTASDLKTIRLLLGELVVAPPREQRRLRSRLRDVGFDVSVWSLPANAFTPADLDRLVQRGVVTVLP